MKRAAVLVGILALALAPCTALAQDFLGVGPYFGLGGTSSSGEVKAKPPCVLYVGYSGDPGSSTAFNIYAQGIGLYSTMDIAFTYAVRGLWLGASQTLGLSDHVGVVGSFWYLFPDRAVESR